MFFMSRGIERMKNSIELYKSFGLLLFNSGTTVLYNILGNSLTSKPPLYELCNVIAIGAALGSGFLFAFNYIKQSK